MSREVRIVATSMSEAFSKIKRDFGSDVLITHQKELDGQVEIGIALPDLPIHSQSSHRERVNGGLGLTNIKPFIPEKRIEKNIDGTNFDFKNQKIYDQKRVMQSKADQNQQTISIPFSKSDADEWSMENEKFSNFQKKKDCDLLDGNIQFIDQLSRYHFLDSDFSQKWEYHLNSYKLISSDTLSQSLLKSISFEMDFLNYFLKNKTSKKFLFLGPSGSGKTVTIAKLAVMLSLLGKNVSIVSLDTIKSTGIDQLKNYIQPLGIHLKTGHSVLKEDDSDDIMLIDTPGMNMFNADDFSYTQSLLFAFDLAPICVLSAEVNPLSLDSLFHIWSKLKIEHIIVTKVDAVKRYGTVLKAGCNGFTLLGTSDSPRIASSLKTFNSGEIVSMMIQSMKDNA